MDNKKEIPFSGTSKDPVSYLSFPRVCVISITVVTIKEFIERVSKRGSEIIKAKGFSAVFPAGKALCDHLRDWFHGTN